MENERLTRPQGTLRWDLIWLGAFLIFATWLMFATLSFKNGQFQIAFKAWTDFGANVSVTQSFALGHNFPPEHPFFPGELIRYHFLFWFQTGNLEFLGLNPVWSINILSILSLLALLILIMTFGEVLFNSRVVGRIGALLFFFSSSLSYLPFLDRRQVFAGALNSIVGATEFLASGYPFRGETWGVLSANVFAYQRHLISGIGLLFVALIFAVERYRTHWSRREEETGAQRFRLLAPTEASEVNNPEPSDHEVVTGAQPSRLHGRGKRDACAPVKTRITRLGFCRRDPWSAAVLEQPDLHRRARDLRLPVDFRPVETGHCPVARGRDCRRFAAGAAAALRKHADVFAFESGIHVRESDALAHAEVPGLDVWCEVDPFGRRRRFLKRLSTATALGAVQSRRHRLSVSAQHGYLQQSQAAEHLGDVRERLCGFRALANRETEDCRNCVGDCPRDCDGLRRSRRSVSAAQRSDAGRSLQKRSPQPVAFSQDSTAATCF